MIAYQKRCIHCNDVYTYHASGNWIPKYNNDRFCPVCQEAIEAALALVPKVKEKELLPTLEDHPITIEIFKQKYKEWEDKNIIHLHRFHCGIPDYIKIKELKIDGVEYRLTLNTITNKELLEVEYQKDLKTNEIEGLWYEYRDRFSK